MSDFQLQALIRGVILPGGLSAIVFALSRLLPLGLRRPLRQTAIAASVGLAMVLFLGLPTWLWKGSPDGVWMALLMVSVLAVFDGISVLRIWTRRYIVLALIALTILRPLIETSWTLAFAMQTILALTAIAVAIWWGFERGGSRVHQSAVSLEILLVATGAAILMGIEGSASLAQITGAFCAALGVVWVFTFARIVKVDFEFIMPSLLILFGLVLAHVFYVDANGFHWLWVLTPLVWPFIRAFWPRTFAWSVEIALTLATSLPPILVALVMAYKAMPEPY